MNNSTGEPPGNYPPLAVTVWGEMALFTRPEAKAERVSYPVMTPSAARGVLEAIYWKPEFRYRVRRITVLSPIRYASIFRNEVNGKASHIGARANGFYADDERQQRHSLVLRGLNREPVKYRIEADVVLNPGADKNDAAYRDQFRRRVERGECFHRPCLGCREFAADFAVPDASQEQIPDELRGKTLDLGMMLLDIAYGGASGINIPLFFEAHLVNGVLTIPDAEYERLEAVRL